MNNEQRNIKYKQTTFGYGKRLDFTDQAVNLNPGPIYENHSINSISYRSKYRNSPSMKGFMSPHSKYDPIIYKGQEKHYYGREGAGPGAYLE
jgi:hypothetical protein